MTHYYDKPKRLVDSCKCNAVEGSTEDSGTTDFGLGWFRVGLTEDSRTTDFGLGWFRVGLTKDSRTIDNYAHI